MEDVLSPRTVGNSEPLEGPVDPLLAELRRVGDPSVRRALGISRDRAGWPEVVGTVAGDDTLLVVARGGAARRRVAGRLADLAAIP